MMTGATSCILNRSEDADMDGISMSANFKFKHLKAALAWSMGQLFTGYKNPEQATFDWSSWLPRSIKAVIAPTASASNTSTAVAPQTGPVGTAWVLDSAASCCVTGDLSVIHGLHSAQFVPATAANGQPMWSELCGRAVGRVNISGIRYFEGAKMNLISSGFLVRQGCDIRHTVEGVQIWKGDVIVGSGHLLPNNLWQLDFLNESHLDGPACTICPSLDAHPLHAEGFAADAVSASDDADSSRAEYGMKEGKAKTSATWCVGTGATHHATGNRDLLSGFIMEHDDQFVHAVDGVPMKVVARGAVITDTVALPDVWFVPGLTENLVSVNQLVELDYSVTFRCGECYIRSTDGKVVGQGNRREGGLYELDFLKVPLAI